MAVNRHKVILSRHCHPLKITISHSLQSRCWLTDWLISYSSCRASWRIRVCNRHTSADLPALNMPHSAWFTRRLTSAEPAAT